MKHIALFLVISLLIMLGCTNTHSIYFNRYTEEIKSIQYNDIELVKDDYQAINDILENIEFNDKKHDNLDSSYSTLTITTIENDIHKFYIYPNNVIKYVSNNKTYYADNNTSNLLDIYNKDKDKYYDMSFFDIGYNSNIIGSDKDIIININNINVDGFKFISTKDIYDINVYPSGNISNEQGTIKSIYTNNKIVANTPIIFKDTLNKNNPSFKITFKTEYNYEVEITPTYNINKQKIDIIKIIKPINNN